MLDSQKLWIVARFELKEAIRSRLFMVALSLYGLVAGVGSFLFIKSLNAAEEAARHSLAVSLRMPESQLPPDLVKGKAMQALIQFVGDEATRQELLRMPAHGIFYGFLALKTVALIVLTISTGSLIGDLENGAARYALVRCDRTTWTLGKLLGQELILATGLIVGALVASCVGTLMDANAQPETWLWLLRVSFRSWIYANAYLGIFIGVSTLADSALKARALALATWIGLEITHGIVVADFANKRLPWLHWLGFLFPSAHQSALWSPLWGVYLRAAAVLMGIGVLGVFLAHQVLQRRDA